MKLTLSMLSLVALCVACNTTQPQKADHRPVVGAIRWDAWHGDKSPVGRAVETALGPKQWHYRVPFFGKIISDTQVEIRGYTQKIVDQEIAYARRAGLDYWAFGLYSTLPAMTEARALYLSSRHKSDINFCLWTDSRDLSSTENLHRIIQLMREPTYQKVLGNRPLFYFYRGTIDEKGIKLLGNQHRTDELRRLAQQAGLGNPYLVLMDFSAAHGKNMAAALGFDALTSYACPGSLSGHGTYAALADHTEKFWEECKATGKEVVPIVMASADRRPRVEHPMPWERHQKPGVGMDKFYEMPTPAELTMHLDRALTWINQNPTAAPAQAVIIYAWNENDEGGWLVPTLSEGTARIEAVAKILRK
ncbi:MAG: hypothetical protein EPN23_06210 [Verrucomicrobia bacterium]|nr:MAG: hypothetical protein EPN23_06210 [Verrucomicrobiota bacterium]